MNLIERIGLLLRPGRLEAYIDKQAQFAAKPTYVSVASSYFAGDDNVAGRLGNPFRTAEESAAISRANRIEGLEASIRFAKESIERYGLAGSALAKAKETIRKARAELEQLSDSAAA